MIRYLFEFEMNVDRNTHIFLVAEQQILIRLRFSGFGGLVAC